MESGIEVGNCYHHLLDKSQGCSISFDKDVESLAAGWAVAHWTERNCILRKSVNADCRYMGSLRLVPSVFTCETLANRSCRCGLHEPEPVDTSLPQMDVLRRREQGFDSSSRAVNLLHGPVSIQSFPSWAELLDLCVNACIHPFSHPFHLYIHIDL